MTSSFQSATSFRKSLEARLLNYSQKSNIDLERLRRKVAFDRLLARFFDYSNPQWLLKGGYGLELRFAYARATKDIDLALVDRIAFEITEELILELLQERAERPIDDYFTFQISAALKVLEGPPEGGFRFPVTSIVDGRKFVNFHVDVGVGDALVEPSEIIEGEDWLGFAGIAQAKICAISKEQQFAEKLHTYTKPRIDSDNSRAKDLADMILLI